MTDVMQAKPDIHVPSLSGPELLLLHTELHSYWKEISENDRPVEGWDEQSLIEVHEKVFDALERRDLPHQRAPIGEGLDDGHPNTKQGEIDAIMEKWKPDPYSPSQQIVNALDDSFMEIGELRRQIDASGRVFEQRLKDLVESGWVECVGSDYYRLVPQYKAELSSSWDVSDLEEWA